MTKCGFCEKRKGKRDCPALGTVCSQCCGAHRVKDIACPSSCSWLGGLAVLQGHAVVDVAEARAAFKDATRAYVEWAADNAREFLIWASDMLMQGPEEKLEPWLSPLFDAAVRYGLRDMHGKRLVDRYLDEQATRLPRTHVAALAFLRSSWASIFRIEDVREHMLLRDLVDDQLVEVETVQHLESAKGKLVYAWVIPFGATNVLTVTFLFKHEDENDDVVKKYKAALAALGAPTKSHRELAGEVMDVVVNFARHVHGVAQDTRRSGRDVISVPFCVLDADTLRARLDTSALLQRDDADPRCPHWKVGAGGEAIAAHIELLPPLVEIIAETDDAAAALRALTAPLLDGVAEHLDVDDARLDAMVKAGDRVYRLAILDVPHADLGGQTPRAACATRMGRMAVDALITRWGEAREAIGEELRTALGIVEGRAAVEPRDAMEAKDAAFGLLDAWERTHGDEWFAVANEAVGIDEATGRVLPEHLLPLLHLVARHGALEDHDRMIDVAYDELEKKLTPELVVALMMGVRAWASFFEIVAVREGAFELRDLVDGALLTARSAHSEQRVPGLCLYAWIVPWGASNEVMAAVDIDDSDGKLLATYRDCLGLEQERWGDHCDHRELSAVLCDVVVTEALDGVTRSRRTARR